MGSLIILLPLLLLAYLFWTQRKRQQQMRSAQDSIQVGQEISTTSGLLGTLVALDDEEGTIEVSPGVQLRFVRRAIVPRSQVGAAAPAETADAESTQIEPTPAESTPADIAEPGPVDLGKREGVRQDGHTPETKAE